MLQGLAVFLANELTGVSRLHEHSSSTVAAHESMYGTVKIY